MQGQAAARGEQALRNGSVVEHLYVHIPFCPKLCPYCSFFSEVTDRAKTTQFLEALVRELEVQCERIPLRPRTIFFGGGTPSALSTPQLEWLLSRLRERLDLSNLAEWTLEMNPATVSLEKATLLRELGVTRISMGVQSWNAEMLDLLGRVHSASQAERSYHLLREAGFQNVNLDFMFGIPGQTLEVWEETLERTLALGPDHISAYSLTYEEDTEFFERRSRGELTRDPELDAQFFEVVMTRLEAAGYRHYEISNYAKPNRECLHNLAYWLGNDYLGIGPSAFSTVGQARWANAANTELYTSEIASGRPAATFVEDLDPSTRRREALAFSLRTNRGIEIDPAAPWHRDLERYETEGLVDRQASRWIITRQGRMVADELAEAFF